jgi:hypothetical protein
MDDCPVTGQSPQGRRRNVDPAVDPDYGLARKPFSPRKLGYARAAVFERDHPSAGAAN